MEDGMLNPNDGRFRPEGTTNQGREKRKTTSIVPKENVVLRNDVERATMDGDATMFHASKPVRVPQKRDKKKRIQRSHSRRREIKRWAMTRSFFGGDPSLVDPSIDTHTRPSIDGWNLETRKETARA